MSSSTASPSHHILFILYYVHGYFDCVHTSVILALLRQDRRQKLENPQPLKDQLVWHTQQQTRDAVSNMVQEENEYPCCPWHTCTLNCTHNHAHTYLLQIELIKIKQCVLSQMERGMWAEYIPPVCFSRMCSEPWS